MKESRPKKIVSLKDAPLDGEGWYGLFQKHANTIFTIVLLILAGVMFVRWRLQTAANAKIVIGNDLATAQTQVNELRSGQFPTAQSPADTIKAIQQAQTQASGAISNVLNSSDADEQMHARALILRGDMYWYLANMPPLAGSESEPTLRLSDSNDALLQKSAESYQQVLKDPAYSNQHEAIDVAHMGLEAIAENKGDWDTAQKELQAIINDPHSVSVLVDQAKMKLDLLPTLKQPMFVVPPTGTPTSQPTTSPTTGPVVPLGPSLPSGFAIPTTIPTTARAATMPAGH